MDSVSQKTIENRSKLFFDIYVNYENKDISIRKKFGNFLRNKMPKIYSIYRKIIRK